MDGHLPEWFSSPALIGMLDRVDSELAAQIVQPVAGAIASSFGISA
jgi:hypothetical protein